MERRHSSNLRGVAFSSKRTRNTFVVCWENGSGGVGEGGGSERRGREVRRDESISIMHKNALKAFGISKVLRVGPADLKKRGKGKKP